MDEHKKREVIVRFIEHNIIEEYMDVISSQMADNSALRLLAMWEFRKYLIRKVLHNKIDK